jgi:membrane associated rhomboid family serine protease
MVFSVGASGAIFGLLGSFAVLLVRLGYSIQTLVPTLLINAVISFLPGIDWRAHVGGFIGGAVLTAVFVYAPPSARRWVAPVATVAAFVVLAVLATARTAVLVG